MVDATWIDLGDDERRGSRHQSRAHACSQMCWPLDCRSTRRWQSLTRHCEHGDICRRCAEAARCRSRVRARPVPPRRGTVPMRARPTRSSQSCARIALECRAQRGAPGADPRRARAGRTSRPRGSAASHRARSATRSSGTATEAAPRRDARRYTCWRPTAGPCSASPGRTSCTTRKWVRSVRRRVRSRTDRTRRCASRPATRDRPAEHVVVSVRRRDQGGSASAVRVYRGSTRASAHRGRRSWEVP